MKYGLALLLLLIMSCTGSDNQNPSSFLGEAMTMQYRILVGGELDWDAKRKVKQLIVKTFNDVDTVYNKWNPGSEISRLNRSRAFEKIRLSTELENFLSHTDRLISMTQGRFDPTIEPVLTLWKQELTQGKIPSEEVLAEKSRLVGWNKVHCENGYFWKEQNGLQLDLGGIAKGFAIDLMVERLNSEGYADVYVEWGGEIRASGRHPEGRPWRISVSKLGGSLPSESLAVVDFEDEAVASSGDYLQQWTVEGTTYFHIIDTKTCRPLIAKGRTVCSATVIAKSCMEADALATAAMTFATPGEANAWLENLKRQIPALKYWTASRSFDPGSN